jgi:hypothetical protein
MAGCAGSFRVAAVLILAAPLLLPACAGHGPAAARAPEDVAAPAAAAPFPLDTAAIERITGLPGALSQAEGVKAALDAQAAATGRR